MALPKPQLPNSSNTLPNARRLFGMWWRRQSPARQDRFATLAPLISVLLFLAAIISAFWYLRNEEIERETESVKRDTEITQQQLGLRLLENQEAAIRLARELLSREVKRDEFLTLATTFSRERTEINQVSWVNLRRPQRTGIGFVWTHSEYGSAAALPEPWPPTETARPPTTP